MKVVVQVHRHCTSISITQSLQWIIILASMNHDSIISGKTYIICAGPTKHFPPLKCLFTAPWGHFVTLQIFFIRLNVQVDGIILLLDFFLKKPKFWGNSGAVVAATPLCIIIFIMYQYGQNMHHQSIWISKILCI